MSSLCQAHKDELNRDIGLAAANWQSLVSRARQAVRVEDWYSSVMIYKCALEVAEIILTMDNGDRSQDRFLRTSIELMHALRNSEYSDDAYNLFEYVIEKLDIATGYDFDPRFLEPLESVTVKNLSQVNEWMNKWHGIFDGTPRQVH